MCFMLHAGTSSPIPRSEWKKESPAIWVRPLVEGEERIRAHFSKPEVQYIGSTSCCGCDFPNAMFQGGDWPEIEFAQVDEEAIDEESVELYGVWAGDYET